MRVDAAAYPAASSDIAALLVFDHQGRAINLLTRLGWETRIAAAEGRLDFSKGDLGAVLEETVDYLLFVGRGDAGRAGARRLGVLEVVRRRPVRTIARVDRCGSSICSHGCSSTAAVT